MDDAVFVEGEVMEIAVSHQAAAAVVVDKVEEVQLRRIEGEIENTWMTNHVGLTMMTWSASTIAAAAAAAAAVLAGTWWNEAHNRNWWPGLEETERAMSTLSSSSLPGR